MYVTCPFFPKLSMFTRNRILLWISKLLQISALVLTPLSSALVLDPCIVIFRQLFNGLFTFELRRGGRRRRTGAWHRKRSRESKGHGMGETKDKSKEENRISRSQTGRQMSLNVSECQRGFCALLSSRGWSHPAPISAKEASRDRQVNTGRFKTGIN